MDQSLNDVGEQRNEVLGEEVEVVDEDIENLTSATLTAPVIEILGCREEEVENVVEVEAATAVEAETEVEDEMGNEAEAARADTREKRENVVNELGESATSSGGPRTDTRTTWKVTSGF